MVVKGHNYTHKLSLTSFFYEHKIKLDLNKKQVKKTSKMPEKYEKAIKLIQKLTPKTSGLKEGYYKVEDDKLELLLLIGKKNAPNTISYLRSLSSIVEGELKGVEIETNIYISEKQEQKKVKDVVEKEKLKKMKLTSNYV